MVESLIFLWHDDEMQCESDPMHERRSRMYFVVGCARSGTTSLTRIMNMASNTECLVEPVPNLNWECREIIEGRIRNPYQVVAGSIVQRAAEVLDQGLIYGEKNVTLGPFLPHIYELTGGRFVYIYRDGRDVVRSLINWHNQMFGSVYRECKDPGDLSPRAIEAVSNLPIELDTSDYSRPRPQPGDIWYDQWEHLSRLEMCAWYWSRINELYLDQLEQLPRHQWISINYTNPSAEDISRVCDFLGLEGLSQSVIQEALDRKLNSLEERVGEVSQFPRWPKWGHLDRVRFENIAARTMQRLEIYPKDGFIRYCPHHYGDWWRQHEGGLDWYTWMYNSRLSAHQDLLQFIDNTGEDIQSVLDVGCGFAVGYADALQHKRFVGLDLSENAIQWCRNNRTYPNHDYMVSDIMQSPPQEKFDLVFSQGTIDNTYDMNAYIRAMVTQSKKWIYITAYRGWFPELNEHRYSWSEDTTCFYNDISPHETRQFLESIGCKDIRVEPLKMENAAVPFETRIIARVP